MLNEKIIKICEQKFIYLNYSQKQIIHLNSNDFQTY